jgi:hypothetical protein
MSLKKFVRPEVTMSVCGRCHAIVRKLFSKSSATLQRSNIVFEGDIEAGAFPHAS